MTDYHELLESVVDKAPIRGVMEFEWDTVKEEANLEKHGIRVAEAMTVFGDPLEMTTPDPDHSENEFRGTLQPEPVTGGGVY